jgi:hypothetical protein
MNSDLNVELSNECDPSACSQCGTLAMLRRHGPQSSRGPRAHAPHPDLHINLMAQAYQPGIKNADASLSGGTRRRKGAAFASGNLRSQHKNGDGKPARILPTSLAHQWLICSLFGGAECTKHRVTRRAERSLGLIRGKKLAPIQSCRRPQPPLHMPANCGQANSILATTCAHYWLASIRIPSSSPQQPLESGFNAHPIISTNV